MEGGGLIHHSPESLPGTTMNIYMYKVSSGSPFEPIKYCKQYSKEKINIGQLQMWLAMKGGGSEIITWTSTGVVNPQGLERYH